MVVKKSQHAWGELKAASMMAMKKNQQGVNYSKQQA
jgi:hypothetical protein